jgi:hypothetical protein
MRTISRFKLSPALVVASVALFVALAGTSVAAVTALAPKNSVGSAAVIDGSLQRQDLDPAVAASTDAFASWNNGPLAIPEVTTTKTLARLAIPAAGSYVISAKAFVDTNFPDQAPGDGVVVRCVLDAVGDVDYTLTNIHGATPTPLAFDVVHRFPGPGVVTLQCGFGSYRLVGQVVSLRWVKIVAVKVANLTNTGPDAAS